MEYRWFKANVRKDNAIGVFYNKDFLLHVPITGSHDLLMQSAIEGIRKAGYQTNHIVSHSINRSTL